MYVYSIYILYENIIVYLEKNIKQMSVTIGSLIVSSFYFDRFIIIMHTLLACMFYKYAYSFELNENIRRFFVIEYTFIPQFLNMHIDIPLRGNKRNIYADNIQDLYNFWCKLHLTPNLFFFRLRRIRRFEPI